MVAVENSQDDLNDERLFGSLNTNQNLIEEGNIVLVSNVNNSANNDKNEIVFEDAPPVSNGTDVRPTKVGNAIMTGIGSRQNPHTP